MPTCSRRRQVWRSAGLPWLVGLGSFAYLTAFPRVLNVADESFVLYGASRILQGQAIYRDFFEFITPGSFYFFAGIFAITGPSLLAARAAMAAVNALSCVLLFTLASEVASAVEACVAVAMFAMLCVPVWPQASPHWLSTTLCLATAAVLLGDRRPKAVPIRAAAAGILSALTFCTQQHRGVFLTLWAGVTIVLLAAVGPRELRWQRCKRQFIWGAVGWLGAVVPILGYTAWRASFGQMFVAIFSFLFSNYYPFVHGNNTAGHMAWAGVLWINKGNASLTSLKMLEMFPAVLVCEAIALGWEWRQARNRAQGVRASCLLLAVLMSMCILYFPDFIHVAIIAPFFLIVAARLAYAVRSMHFWNRSRFLRYAPALALAMVFALVLNKGRTNLHDTWKEVSEHVETALGTVHAPGYAHGVLQTVRSVLERSPSKRKTLFSYPMDASFYLMLPVDNPTRFDLLQRGFNSREQFQEVIATLRKHPPDVVVVNSWFSKANTDPLIQSVVRNYQLAAKVFMYDIYSRKL